MVWHDCKTDPPKKDGEYLIAYWLHNKELSWLSWQCGYWNDTSMIFEILSEEARWGGGYFVPFKQMYGEPYKWAEVDLSEVK